MAGNIGSWNFLNSHVDPNALTRNNDPASPRGNYISSESIVLCSAPGTFAAALEESLQNIVPIGVCDTIQVMQNKGVVQLYEIGSRIPYIIPGRPITQFQISRVLFNGDTLLAALTTGAMRQGDIDPDPALWQQSVMGGPGSQFDIPNSNGEISADHTGNFFLNLASHFFNTPFGLAIFVKDSENEWSGGFFAENCVIQQHSMSIQGQNMIVMENASIRCTAFVPIEQAPGTGGGAV